MGQDFPNLWLMGLGPLLVPLIRAKIYAPNFPESRKPLSLSKWCFSCESIAWVLPIADQYHQRVSSLHISELSLKSLEEYEKWFNWCKHPNITVQIPYRQRSTLTVLIIHHAVQNVCIISIFMHTIFAMLTIIYLKMTSASIVGCCVFSH